MDFPEEATLSTGKCFLRFLVNTAPMKRFLEITRDPPEILWLIGTDALELRV